jgi:polyphosphate:AMP phosphotransferase
VGILFGSWYSQPIVQRVLRHIKGGRFDALLDRVAFFEKMLVDDGALMIKLWLHLSKKAQRKRLIQLEEDPKTRWRVLPTDWEYYQLYSKFITVSERAIRHTDAGYAPWHLIDAGDRRYRDLTAGRIILDAIKQRLTAPVAAKAPASPAALPPAATEKGQLTILKHVDLSQRLSEKEYDQRLEKYQGRLTKLAWAAYRKKVSTVAVFEGWDAAGKGGAIRRITAAIDPRLYRVVPIAAPTDEERARHYLWRFWRHLPRSGMTTVYDRSWYGRVLVERVEGFATEDEWKRAYLEINDFEEQLTESGIVVCKFWLHISKDEQLRRFKERQKIAFKQYKITDEDWRNREKWGAYETAVNDMVTHTSTTFAPWTLVAGNDKKVARVQVLKTVCDALEKAL